MILGLLLAASILFVLILRREWRKTRLAGSLVGLRSEAPDSIGVSVLCSDLESISQIGRLLSVEYGRYEVVAVVDSLNAVELFHHIVAHYRMIETAWNPPQGSKSRIRGVWRSRSRRFRRLVLVESPAVSSEAQQCAAEVASHEFFIPLPAYVQPYPGAVERLVAEVAAAPRDAVLLVRSMLGAPLTLIRRDVADIPHSKIPRRRMRRIWHVLARGRHAAGWLLFLSVLFVAITLFAAAAMEGMHAVVMTLAAALGLSAAGYLGTVYAGMPVPEIGKIVRKAKI